MTRVYFSVRLHVSYGLTMVLWRCSLHLPHPEDQVQGFSAFSNFFFLVLCVYLCSLYKKPKLFSSPKNQCYPIGTATTPTESEKPKLKQLPPSCCWGTQ